VLIVPPIGSMLLPEISYSTSLITAPSPTSRLMRNAVRHGSTSPASLLVAQPNAASVRTTDQATACNELQFIIIFLGTISGGKGVGPPDSLQAQKSQFTLNSGVLVNGHVAHRPKIVRRRASERGRFVSLFTR
jgi:hypothetical protein